jgi:hypothetical protein
MARCKSEIALSVSPRSGLPEDSKHKAWAWKLALIQSTDPESVQVAVEQLVKSSIRGCDRE